MLPPRGDKNYFLFSFLSGRKQKREKNSLLISKKIKKSVFSCLGLEGVWKLSGGCLAGVCWLSKGCLEGAWRVS